jgi:competence protein ComEA
VRDLLNGYDDGSADPAAPSAATSLRDRLAARVPLRLDPGRRGALAVGVAVVAAAVVTGLWLMADRPRAIPVSAAAPMITGAAGQPTTRPPGRTTDESSSPPPAKVVVVDVAGKVRRPGLYRLPDGARVDDALRAAGGALGGVDISGLNLAARVVDGQQVLVGLPGPGPPPVAGPSTATVYGPVDLNAANAEQLATLPGIGAVLAARIIDWRTAHGGFASVDQLNEVSGIGEVKFAALRALVAV